MRAKEETIRAIRMEGKFQVYNPYQGAMTPAGHSRDATSMATAFEPLNRSLETFLTRLSRTNERSEKSKMVFKKPRCYKDESDSCIDTWIEKARMQCAYQ